MGLLALPTFCRCDASVAWLQRRSRAYRASRPCRTLSYWRQQTSGNELSPEEFFRSFLRSRQTGRDLVSRASDLLWRRELDEIDDAKRQEVQKKLSQIQKVREEDEDFGFLKLTKARSWSLGVEDAPTNSGRLQYEKEKANDDRRRQSMLEYEALKRELSVMTIAVASLCDLYCVVVLSPQAALSYAIGALGSWFYLHRLYQYADNLSEDDVADVFRKRRFRRIGIRSSDLEESFSKTVEGLKMVMKGSSRLAIPAALFALTAAFDHFTPDNLQLQTPPLMLGFFAYKAAALIQAYRDNKDLLIIFETNNVSPKQ